MLVRAFADDPVANFMFTGERRRRRGLHAFFTSQLRRQYLPYREVYTTDTLDAVAIWGPPDRQLHRQSLRELFELLPTAPFLAPRMVRALRLLFQIDGLHPKEPHWYLATLGTEPSRQGHGIGSALLRSVLDRVDEEGVPAYLESSKDRNVPLYARFGFEVVDELRSRADRPTVWRMWREPRPPEA
jgi:GNAT superfamily N-acetyltransferase